MKRKTASFTGRRAIFTGSPAIVPGGFNLDVTNQSFAVGTVIPAGSLAIYDEQTRLVQIVRTAEVKEIDSDDSKIVYLKVDEFFEPCFAVGNYVLEAGTGATAIGSVPTISKIERSNGVYKVTLSAAITGLAAGDILEEYVSDKQSTANSKEIGTANAVTIYDVEVGEDETGIDVSADTMQYALLARRVPPIPASQKATDNSNMLKGNIHIKLSQSY